jgi:hypothetical protein
MKVLTAIGKALVWVAELLAGTIFLILWLAVSLVIACIPVVIVLWFFGVI